MDIVPFNKFVVSSLMALSLLTADTRRGRPSGRPSLSVLRDINALCSP